MNRRAGRWGRKARRGPGAGAGPLARLAATALLLGGIGPFADAAGLVGSAAGEVSLVRRGVDARVPGGIREEMPVRVCFRYRVADAKDFFPDRRETGAVYHFFHRAPTSGFRIEIADQVWESGERFTVHIDDDGPSGLIDSAGQFHPTVTDSLQFIYSAIGGYAPRSHPGGLEGAHASLRLSETGRGSSPRFLGSSDLPSGPSALTLDGVEGRGFVQSGRGAAQWGILFSLDPETLRIRASSRHPPPPAMGCSDAIVQRGRQHAA